MADLDAPLQPATQIGKGGGGHADRRGHPGHRKRQVEVRGAKASAAGRRWNPSSTASDDAERARHPAPESPMSRMADHRREHQGQNGDRRRSSPKEPTHQIGRHQPPDPSGADAMVVAMVCSVFELARVTSQHSTTANTARPRRIPITAGGSDRRPPGRRRWPARAVTGLGAELPARRAMRRPGSGEPPAEAPPIGHCDGRPASSVAVPLRSSVHDDPHLTTRHGCSDTAGPRHNRVGSRTGGAAASHAGGAPVSTRSTGIGGITGGDGPSAATSR